MKCNAQKVLQGQYTLAAIVYQVPVYCYHSLAPTDNYSAAEENHSDAKPLYKRSFSLLEKGLSFEHSDVLATDKTMTELMVSQVIIFWNISCKWYDFPRNLVLRCRAPGVPTAHTYTVVAPQGKYDEAGVIYRESLAMSQKVFGQHHPDVAHTHIKLAELLKAQVSVSILSSDQIICGAWACTRQM